MFNIYKGLNKEEFDVKWIEEHFNDFIGNIYRSFKQDPDQIGIEHGIFNRMYKDDDDGLDPDKAVLGFSGGLDSVYQLIKLLEAGKEVVCFHVKNINTYENGQASKQCSQVIGRLRKRFGESKIIEANASIAKNWKKDEQFRQFWPENPMKNQLIISMMMDYAWENGIKYVSLGDDFALGIEDAVPGINLTDAREVTESFLKGASSVYVGIKFLPIDDKSGKIDRIKKLDEYGLRDDYYSCVQAGRFNKSYHDRCEKKYGVKLPARSCGCYCRKCAMHCLLEHYSGYVTYPEEFISKCWERMWKNSHSADYELFKPELPLDTRINNLFNY
jgi:hypothetical protein